jgi:hypothetical protein
MGQGKCESFFKYLVHNTETGEKKRFKMVNDIKKYFGIPKTAVYTIINKKPYKKYSHFDIEKIKEPVFKIIEINYN